MDNYLQIAEAIKKDISKIIADALSNKARYTHKGLILWNLVENDMHAAIDHHLTAAEKDKN